MRRLAILLLVAPLSSCAPDLATECDADRPCAGNLICVDLRCRVPCTSTSDCPAGEQCRQGICQAAMGPDSDPGPSLALGAACTEATQCQSSLCVDGVCCDSTCSGNCDRCNLPGRAGECAADDAACIGNCDLCNPLGGDCAPSLALCGGNCAVCAGGGNAFECQASPAACLGNCDVCQGTDTTFNCAPNPTSCAGDCALCQGSGNSFNCTGNEAACVPSCESCVSSGASFVCIADACPGTLPNGQLCAAASDCQSGFCADGVCCTSACGGNCDRCDLPGQAGSCLPDAAGCSGNCGRCDPLSGSCAADATRCTGDCSVCGGTGTAWSCSAEVALCAASCELCSGGGTSFSCAADPSCGPTPPTAGMRLWLRADAGVVATAGAVSEWQDQSGTGVNATMSTPTKQPQLIDAAIAGKPALSFDADDYLQFSLAVSGWTVVTLAIVVANGPNSYNGNTGGVENAPLFWDETALWGTMHLSPFSSIVRYRFGTGQSDNLPTYTRPAAIGSTPTMAIAVKRGADESLYVNGALVLSETGKLTALGNCSSTAFIGRGDANTYFNGQIAEILLYNRALQATEIDQLTTYLTSKYLP